VTMNDVMQWLKRHDACVEGCKWSKQFKTPQEWWNSIEKPHWMLWAITRLYDFENEPDLRRLILARAECAKLIYHLMDDVLGLNRNAVDTAIAFGKGLATREELISAAKEVDTVDAYCIPTDFSSPYAVAYSAVKVTPGTANVHEKFVFSSYFAKQEVQFQAANIIRRHYKIDEILQAMKGAG